MDALPTLEPPSSETPVAPTTWHLLSPSATPPGSLPPPRLLCSSYAAWPSGGYQTHCFGMVLWLSIPQSEISVLSFFCDASLSSLIEAQD